MNKPETLHGFSCGKCGAQTRFDPSCSALMCSSCGHIASVEPHTAAIDSHYFDPNGFAEPDPINDGQIAHACLSCGGEVVFFGASLSEHCPYCDGALTKSGTDFTYPIDAVLPFSVDQETALHALRRWLGARLFAPRDLNALKNVHMSGLYVPFWSFEVSESATFTIVVYEDEKEVKHQNSSQLYYRDVLLPASPHVSNFIRDAALDIVNTDDLRPYDPRLLAGFSAERHHIAVDTAMKSAKDDFHFRRRAQIEYQEGIVHEQIVDIRPINSQINYKRILLPVWMVHYEYGGETYTGVVSGDDHSVYGKRPVVRWKLAVIAGVLAFPIILIGMSIGIAWS